MYLPFSGLGFECGLYVKHLKHGFISEDQNNLRVGDYVMKVRNQIWYYCDGKPLGLVIGQYLQVIQFLRFTVIAVIFMKAIRHVFGWGFTRVNPRALRHAGCWGALKNPAKSLAFCCHQGISLTKQKRYCGSFAMETKAFCVQTCS